MHRIAALVIIFLSTLQILPAQLIGHWESRSPMPVRRSNMATASLQIGDTTWIYTFMGIDSNKTCGQAIRLEAYKYNTVSDQWSPIASVPDTAGRIAASATGLNGKVYLIGGYHVHPDCDETTSSRLDIYDPLTDTWSAGPTMLIRVDDHVQVTWKDSLIILVSGWSGTANTRAVTIYDTYLNQWSQANNVGGPGLFGHAGSIVGDTILYIDGALIQGPTFSAINAARMGVIQNGDPHLIAWTPLGAHPGPKVYRGGGFSYGSRILFTGGTSNAFNIDGIGYNGVPSVESGRTFGYDLATATWEEYARNPDSVMDVREVVKVGENEFFVVGGMEANQTVTNKVSVFVVDTVLVGQKEQAQDELGMIVSPNPAKKTFRLRIVLSAPAQAQVQLRDAAGRIVAELMQETLPAGSTVRDIHPQALGLTAGLYFVDLVAGAQRRTEKLILVD